MHQSYVEKGLLKKFRDVSGDKFLELLRIVTEVEGWIDLLPIMNLNKNSHHGLHVPMSRRTLLENLRTVNYCYRSKFVMTYQRDYTILIRNVSFYKIMS